MKKINRTLQVHTKNRLQEGQKLKKEEIVQFIDDFQKVMTGDEGKRKLISLRVPEKLLELFKKKSEIQSTPYQTQLVRLMREWVTNGDKA